MVQMFSDLANFSVLEGNMVTSKPGDDCLRVGNILPQMVRGCTVQKCIKS